MFGNSEASKDILSVLIGSVALLDLSTVEINSLRRNLVKDRFPGHLRRLAKNVPPDCKFLFEEDIQKRVS